VKKIVRKEKIPLKNILKKKNTAESTENTEKEKVLLILCKNMKKKQTFPPTLISSAGNVASWVGGATPF
jgi:hypothetical protein